MVFKRELGAKNHCECGHMEFLNWSKIISNHFINLGFLKMHSLISSNIHFRIFATHFFPLRVSDGRHSSPPVIETFINELNSNNNARYKYYVARES